MITRNQIDFSVFRKCYPHGERMIECYEHMTRHHTALYGQMLMDTNPQAVVHVVANPVSAVLCAIEHPVIPSWHGVWVATEQAVLTDRHFETLIGRRVMFHPTGKQCLQWRAMETRWRFMLDSSWVDDTFDLLQILWPDAANADPAHVYLMPPHQRQAFFDSWLSDPLPFLQTVITLPGVAPVASEIQ